MRQEGPHSIYNLVCPTTGAVVYIGYSNNLKKRYMGHIHAPSAGLRPFIKELKAKGLMPIMNELETGLVYAVALRKEKEWIERVQAEYGTLLNKRGVLKPGQKPLPINFLKK
jgi:predicted GIY-YIG superfamily endonuclease